MTSRTVRPAQTGTPVTTPGDRPHLPPVEPTATSRRSDRKTPMAWLPWLLLGLLALTLLGAALLAKAAGSGGDSRDDAAGASSAQTDAAAQSGSAASDAALSAGGQDLLAVEGGKIGSLKGQAAEGTATVESVVADEGFWVGESADSRVFVFLTPEARRSSGESGFQVEPGQTVSLKGSVKAASAEFASSAGVTDAEGAAQLREQGGYVEATAVRLAQ